MSLGSFFGRLAALTGGHVDQVGLEEHVEEPFADAASWMRWLPGSGRGWGVEDMLELRRALFWIAAVLVLLVIGKSFPLCAAAVTNPTESSFRSHLTELSFRRHLADIRTTDGTADDDEPASLGANTPAEAPVSAGGTDTPSIAPFRFANHVAISLRTPPLHYRTFFFFSFALTTPLSPPVYLSDPTPLNKKHAPPIPRERFVLFVGYFGHWVWLGNVPRKVEWLWRLFTEGTKEKGKKKAALLERSGVSDIRAVATKDDSSLGAKAIAGASGLLTTPKHIRRTDSFSNLADHGTLPLHGHPSPIPVAPFVPESRRASIVNLVSAQPLNNANVDLVDASSSPLLVSLKSDLTAAQAVLNDLKSQLHAHEESVTSAHSHLQTSLDELRTRRKEDDAERQELKSKTKSLEDQKRQAETAKREAEKRLRAVEAVRDGIEAKIATAINEIEDLKGNMDISVKNVRMVQEEGAKYLVETREAVESRKAELEVLEGEMGELDARNAELGESIKEAEERLEAAVKAAQEAKKLGPEEEMMMMAAAYEAAAQEGYQHASNNPAAGTAAAHILRDGNHRNSGDQWAHQAAAYMAEAGFPHLDQNYTARPSHSTSFAHLAKPSKHVEEKRPADLIGFEDFGPGAKAKLRPTSTPPASDSGSDVWGHDPGSPNGGISTSFSANLLPQGLFRSLEGDQTPVDASTEADDDDFPDTSLQEALSLPPPGAATVNGHDDSGSESSDEHSPGHEADNELGKSPSGDVWRSPLPAPAGLNPYTLAASQSDHRLLPPSSNTPPGVGGPALPGLPALPGSRRWFSGTNSAENVNLFGTSPSNDSLPIMAGHYEASPFAPSASEKQQLALKWGSLGRKWGAREQAQAQGQSPDQHNTRSFSADLATSPSNSTWLSSRFHPKREQVPEEKPQDEDKLNISNGGSSGEKKPFRFFSLRRPTSSGQGSNSDRSGTSPARGE